jgi:hypothetical protein
MAESEEKNIMSMMKSHFEDDNKSFAKIDKAFERQTLLANQNAEHFSYFNKTLVEIKKILDEDAKETVKFRDFVMAHTERVEPVIKAFENEKAARAYMDEKGEGVVKWSVRIGAVGIIGSALLYILRKVL